MTERGLPIVDGPVACPFVAFDDDRDERATSPDHRHRCYAEVTPAPRALAHQEAYCLSSAFPVCPTFQDWARREAARARPEQPGGGAFIPSRSTTQPAFSTEGGFDEHDEPVYEDPPRRKPQRQWSQPPPWMTRDEAAAAGAAEAGAAEAPEDEVEEVEPAATGLSESFAARMLADGTSKPARPVWAEGDKWDDEIGEDEEVDEVVEPEATAAAPEPPSAPQTRQGRRRERERVLDREEDEREPRARTVAERRRERDVAPSWERPARLEAYPSLRSRRLAELRIPPLLIAAVAIALAAILLFQLPALFGIGNKPAGATPTPTVGASVAPTSAAPTSIPGAPTPQVYVVQAGDTMSKIAARFHVPLQALIDANKTSVPDPNQVKIGQMVTIPTALPTTVPGASG